MYICTIGSRYFTALLASRQGRKMQREVFLCFFFLNPFHFATGSKNDTQTNMNIVLKKEGNFSLSCIC